MPPLRDLTGLIVGQLTVLHRAPNLGQRAAWACACACGTQIAVRAESLLTANTRSCGCWKRSEAKRRREKPKPQPGDRFGRLTVLAFLGKQTRYPRVRCQCDCGQITEPHWYNLKSGNTRSCGCWHEEIISARFTTHGRSRTPEYVAWKQLKTRCLLATGKDFPLYGGRGIRVCDRWRSSFANFLADMGPRPTPGHSMDRIDPEGHYEPTNCRWATPREQRLNQRRMHHDTKRNAK